MQLLLVAQPDRRHTVCCQLHRLQLGGTLASHHRAWLLAQPYCTSTACGPATLPSCSTADRLLLVHPGCPPSALSYSPIRTIWQATTARPQRVVPH